MIEQDCVFTSEDQRKLTKLHIDMYEGDGKENPSMTTRMDAVEKATATIGKLFWVVLGLAVTVLGDIISNHIK